MSFAATESQTLLEKMTGSTGPHGSPMCSSSSSSSSCSSTPSTETQLAMEIIKLNIGGKIFHTSLQTLLKKHGGDDDTNFFQVMFSPDIRNNIEFSRDEQGNIFIDRDPRHFHVILNYLRTGELVLPSGVGNSKSGELSRFPDYGTRTTCASPSLTCAGSRSPSNPLIDEKSSSSQQQQQQQSERQETKADKSQLYELLMECEYFQLRKPMTILRRELGLLRPSLNAIGSKRPQVDNSQRDPNPPFPSEEDLMANLMEPSSQYGFLAAHPEVFVVLGSKLRMRQLKTDARRSDSSDDSETISDSEDAALENTSSNSEKQRVFSTLREALECLKINKESETQHNADSSHQSRVSEEDASPIRLILLSGVYERADFDLKITRSNVTIEGAMSANGDGVRIRGFIGINADHCQLRNLRILSEDSLNPAVIIRKNRRGTRIEYCEITSLGTNCLVVESNTPDTIISHNTVAYGKEWGVVIREHGICTLTDNLIHTNQKANVWIDSYACPLLRRNVIHSGRNAAGVWIKSHSRAILEDNVIHSNDCTNVVVDSEADPQLRRNQVYGGKENGIFIKERALGTYEENEIHHNGHPNVALAPHAYSILRNNDIHSGSDCGIWVNSAGGLLEGNNVHDHRYPNITIEESYSTSASSTTSTSNVHSLISSLIDSASGDRELDENDLRSFYTRSPTSENSTRNLVLRANRIHSGRDCGIWLKKNAQCLIDNNLLCFQRRTNLVVEQGSFPIVRRNEIHSGRENGIYLKDNTGGLFEHNDIHSNNYSNMALHSNTTPLLRNNDIHDSDDCGVWIKQSSKGTLVNNRIHHNRGSGVLIDRQAAPVIRNNHIFDNTEEGVLVAKDTKSELLTAIKDNNKLENHRKGDLGVTEFSQPLNSTKWKK